jgi:hypothetical protein
LWLQQNALKPSRALLFPNAVITDNKMTPDYQFYVKELKHRHKNSLLVERRDETHDLASLD